MSPTIALTRPAPDPALPLLLLGPSLGTSADTLWGGCFPALAPVFDIVAWDLPGHGASGASAGPFGVADLAEMVFAAAEPVLADRADSRFHYAGDSLGGAVGLQLLLDPRIHVTAATLLCTGARIGEPSAWEERAALVDAEGTGAVVEGSRQRWFGPGFTDREPAVATALLDALRAADPTEYGRACRALAGFDVRHRLGEITAPVVTVAGREDRPTPVSSLREIADSVVNGRLVVLDGVAHLAPAEAPSAVSDLLIAHHGRAAE
ncbi:MAG: alpha/beta fold hydrolase [Pseudonocardia sp.]|nr:alpha/beta fold hydrolase [Pseudonocardia sp.]